MKYIFVSYVASMGFTDPEVWLERINFYSGILYQLARTDTVISIEQINYEGEFMKNGVQFHFLKLDKYQRLCPGKLHRFIKQQQPDVVFVQGMHSPLQVMQLRLQLGPQVRIINQNHAEQPFNGIKKIFQQLADRCVNAYLFASKEMGLNWVRRGNLASADKIHEVMEVSSVFYPISRECAVSKTGAQGQPVFLWVGRLNDNKDPLMAVRAFLKYAQINPQARLYMIYHTDELLNAIYKVLNGHAYQNNIILIGKVPHDELLYWFNSADFIVSASHYEGSGVAVCEAISCGCIPVVTDIDSFRMMTNNGDFGLLYPLGDEAALLAALKQTQSMPIKEIQAKMADHYTAILSFNAIAGRIRGIAGGLLK